VLQVESSRLSSNLMGVAPRAVQRVSVHAPSPTRIFVAYRMQDFRVRRDLV
jgi:hypothetical protein